MISCVISPVEIYASPRAMSAVRTPSSKVLSTAFSITSASSESPKEKRSIIAAERIVAIGFARPFPAISGADPWIGSYKPHVADPIDADASSPIDPVICDALGEHVLTQYVEGKEKEWDAYRTHVSSWEIERYLVLY